MRHVMQTFDELAFPQPPFCFPKSLSPFPTNVRAGIVLAGDRGRLRYSSLAEAEAFEVRPATAGKSQTEIGYEVGHPLRLRSSLTNQD